MAVPIATTALPGKPALASISHIREPCQTIVQIGLTSLEIPAR